MKLERDLRGRGAMVNSLSMKGNEKRYAAELISKRKLHDKIK